MGSAATTEYAAGRGRVPRSEERSGPPHPQTHKQIGPASPPQQAGPIQRTGVIMPEPVIVALGAILIIGGFAAIAAFPFNLIPCLIGGFMIGWATR